MADEIFVEYKCVDADEIPSKIEKYYLPCRSIRKNIRDLQVGDVLAEDVKALAPYPSVRTAIKDGFAVIASDGESRRIVLETIDAGSLTDVEVKMGTACRVNTGSMVPSGADAVVPVEETLVNSFIDKGDAKCYVELLKQPKSGQEIREVGSDITVGDLLLRKGSKLNSAELGVLVASERRYIEVFKHPKVAVLSCSFSDPNAKQQFIVNDRTYLIALLKLHGYDAIDCYNTNQSNLIGALKNAFSVADIVLLSAGMYSGMKEFIRSVIKDQFNFEVCFEQVKRNMSYPQMFASGTFDRNRKLFFALPIEHLLTWVFVNLYIIPALKKMAGCDVCEPIIMNAVADFGDTLNHNPDFCLGILKQNPSMETQLPVVRCIDVNSSEFNLNFMRCKYENVLVLMPRKNDIEVDLNERTIVQVAEIYSLNQS